MIRQLITKDQVSGELYGGEWVDVGTPDRLADLNVKLQQG